MSFESGQLVTCYQYYACGTICKGWLPGVVIERQDIYGYEGYLVLEQGKFKPVRYDVETLEDYEEFLERQNKFKNESDGSEKATSSQSPAK